MSNKGKIMTQMCYCGNLLEQYMGETKLLELETRGYIELRCEECMGGLNVYKEGKVTKI